MENIKCLQLILGGLIENDFLFFSFVLWFFEFFFYGFKRNQQKIAVPFQMIGIR